MSNWRIAQDKKFNAQGIANIFNALSKWVDTNNIEHFKPLIKNLIAQAVKIQGFNAQEISNIFNALSKWVDTDLWDDFKPLIKNLRAQAVKIQDFNTQHIANIFNALSKWVDTNNIEYFKPLIENLRAQAEKIQGFNAQEIANIFSALSKYPESFIKENSFQDLSKNLVDQIIKTEQFQKRSSASIIRDLPIIKRLITNEMKLNNLLSSIIKSFSQTTYQKKFINMGRYISDENFWTAVGIKNFAKSMKELRLSPDNIKNLKEDFDNYIPEILNKLSRLRLNAHRLVSILEGTRELVSLGFISDSDDIKQSLHELFKKLADPKSSLKPKTLVDLQTTFDQRTPLVDAEANDLKLTPENILLECEKEVKIYRLKKDLKAFKEEVLEKIEYLSEEEDNYLNKDFNDKNKVGHDGKIFIAQVSALTDQWGVYAEKPIEAGELLGIYDGERLRSTSAEKTRQHSGYIFNLSKRIIIDGSEKRNWAAYLNSAIECIANIDALYSSSDRGQIELRSREAIPAGRQLLLYYGEHYFINRDYPPIYLHPKDNFLAPEQHYNKHKDFYSDTVLDLKIAKDLGLKERYLVTTKLFQEIYYNNNENVSKELSNLKMKGEDIDLPSYSVEYIKSQEKWKFFKYASQENITPLMLACYLGNEACVNDLLKHDADPIRKTLHTGHDALFFTVLSSVEFETKQNILNRLITKAYEMFKKKDKIYYINDINEDRLKRNFSNSLISLDASNANIFDYMIEKEEYELCKGYFSGCETEIQITKEIKRKISEKLVSDKGILGTIGNEKIVEIVLENITKEFVDQSLKEIEESGEIYSYNKEKLLTNLDRISPKNKKGKIKSIKNFINKMILQDKVSIEESKSTDQLLSDSLSSEKFLQSIRLRC